MKLSDITPKPHLRHADVLHKIKRSAAHPAQEALRGGPTKRTLWICARVDFAQDEAARLGFPMNVQFCSVKSDRIIEGRKYDEIIVDNMPAILSCNDPQTAMRFLALARTRLSNGGRMRSLENY